MLIEPKSAVVTESCVNFQDLHGGNVWLSAILEQISGCKSNRWHHAQVSTRVRQFFIYVQGGDGDKNENRCSISRRISCQLTATLSASGSEQIIRERLSVAPLSWLVKPWNMQRIYNRHWIPKHAWYISAVEKAYPIGVGGHHLGREKSPWKSGWHKTANDLNTLGMITGHVTAWKPSDWAHL